MLNTALFFRPCFFSSRRMEIMREEDDDEEEVVSGEGGLSQED